MQEISGRETAGHRFKDRRLIAFFVGEKSKCQKRDLSMTQFHAQVNKKKSKMVEI